MHPIWHACRFDVDGGGRLSHQVVVNLRDQMRSFDLSIWKAPAICLSGVTA
jgi:hypothetical protein